MYRLAVIYQTLGSKDGETRWMARAAAAGHIEPRAGGGLPIHAKYQYGLLLAQTGEFDKAVAEMESALAAGDTVAEEWLISQYSRGTPLAGNPFARQRTFTDLLANLPRAVQLIVQRANRQLAREGIFSNERADALLALGLTQMWGASGAADIESALALFEQAWAHYKTSQIAGRIIEALNKGAGSYSSVEREALIREWRSRQLDAEFRVRRAVP